jgi:hypothetical protein
MRASLVEVTTMWTLDDLDEANAVLDAIDAATSLQVKRAERAGGARGPA